MKLTEKTYLKKYSQKIGNEIPSLIKNFNFAKTSGQFDYLKKASAVYSANIEGNSLDLNSYMNYELNKIRLKPDKEAEEIKNLIEAYSFAQKNPLSEKNLLNCHNFFSKSLLIKSKRGKYRLEKIGVFDKSGLVYLAIEPEFVKEGMATFFDEIKTLLDSTLTKEEVFYFASLIHLRLVHLHPFQDGNGRAARLLEKWFITEKLGKDFWTIPSEEYYKNNRVEYYKTINIGVNFYELDYNKCLDFLKMLPNCLKL